MQSIFGIKEMAWVRAITLCTEETYTLALVFHVKIMSLTIIDLTQNEWEVQKKSFHCRMKSDNSAWSHNFYMVIAQNTETLSNYLKK